MGHASHMLLLLVEYVSATGALKAVQERVDVGGVVGGGDTQKLGEGVELLARSDERSAQVLALQRDGIEEGRARKVQLSSM